MRGTRLRFAGLGLALAIAVACGKDVAPPPAVPDAAVEPAAILAALPARPGLAREAGRVVWRDPGGDAAYVVRRVGPGEELWLETPRGALRASRSLLHSAGPSPLAALPALLARADGAGLAPGDLAFERLAVAGPVLRGASHVVIPEAVLRAEDAEPLAAEAEREQRRAAEALAAALDALAAQLETSPLDDASRKALRTALARAARAEAEPDAEPSPAFIRHLLRHGWLEGLFPGDALADLRTAVARAETPLPVRRWAGEDAVIEVREDAFGRTVWGLRAPDRARYALELPGPAYYPGTARVRLAVTLPPGSDPFAEPVEWLSAEVSHDGARLASWDPASGFAADADAWHRLVHPVEPPGKGGDDGDAESFALPDAIPPHVLVVTPGRDVRLLATAYGVVRPVAGGGPDDVERFLAEAATALPDAAHLDLIGQYLYAYAYDSPDPRRPELLGTLELQGDIHQTVSQTLATASGGLYRGDCDDLSELYQAIALRQGRAAHVIGLPAHAAAAWAEPSEGGRWRTFVLQTGEALSVPGDSLRESLEKTYRAFDYGEMLSGDELEVLLRFSGENTRASYFLSHRIFEDAAYARAMIDVQRDWHRWTLRTGVAKMRRLIASGDAGTTSWRELAGLEEVSLEFDAAADAYAEAIRRTTSARDRLVLANRRLGALQAAGRRDEADALVALMLDEWLPEAEDELGREVLDPLLELADRLREGGDSARALYLLAERVAPRIDGRAHWYESESERDQLLWFVDSAIAALAAESKAAREEGGRGDAWRTLSGLVREWFDQLAFDDLDEGESVLHRYDALGRYYEAVYGEAQVRAWLADATPPNVSHDRHGQRGGGAEQRRADARWILVSPLYWSGALAALFEPGGEPPRAVDVIALAARVDAALAQARALGIESLDFRWDERMARLARALALRDDEALRAILRRVDALGDRELYEFTAGWIGRAGSFLSPAEFERALAIARAELHYGPTALAIAWSAASSGAPAAAVAAARAAAEEHPDAPEYATEYAFFRSRLGQSGTAGASPARSATSAPPSGPSQPRGMTGVSKGRTALPPAPIAMQPPEPPSAATRWRAAAHAASSSSPP